MYNFQTKSKPKREVFRKRSELFFYRIKSILCPIENIYIKLTLNKLLTAIETRMESFKHFQTIQLHIQFMHIIINAKSKRKQYENYLPRFSNDDAKHN